MFLNTFNKRKQMIKEQEQKYEDYKERMKDEPDLEKNDYIAMVLGAFWALWPVLLIVVVVIVGVSLLFR